MDILHDRQMVLTYIFFTSVSGLTFCFFRIKSLEAELDSAKTAHDEVVKTMEKEIEVLRSKPEEAHQKFKKIQEVLLKHYWISLGKEGKRDCKLYWY